MKGMTSMYSHEWKARGFFISGVGLGGMILERIRGVIIFNKLSVEQHHDVFQWIMLFGLIVVIYSKEKYEDDRAKMVRLKAFQIAFGVQQGVILAMAFTGSISKKPMGLEAPDLYVFGALGIILYLLIFHVGLYFDFLWDYEDRGLVENFKNMNKNKWGLLVYLLLAAITMITITLFGTR